jgi:hypothetical protein
MSCRRYPHIFACKHTLLITSGAGKTRLVGCRIGDLAMNDCIRSCCLYPDSEVPPLSRRVTSTSNTPRSQKTPVNTSSKTTGHLYILGQSIGNRTQKVAQVSIGNNACPPIVQNSFAQNVHVGGASNLFMTQTDLSMIFQSGRNGKSGQF